MKKVILLVPVFILALSVLGTTSASAKTTERDIEILDLSNVPAVLTIKTIEQPKTVDQLLAEATQKVEKRSSEVQEKKEAVETIKVETTKATESKQTLAEEIAALKAEIEASKQAIADKQAREAAEAAARAAAAAEAARVRVQQPAVGYSRPAAAHVAGNTYTPGQCTYYVKNRRPDIPNNWGNANTWAYNARLAGYAVGSTPAVGAIAAANNEMHVAYVEGVSGNMVTISEMNYGGPWRMNTRTVPAHLFTYIY